MRDIMRRCTVRPLILQIVFFRIENKNQINNNDKNSKHCDLEEMTFQFTTAIMIFVKTLPKRIANIDDGKQLLVFDLVLKLDIVN